MRIEHDDEETSFDARPWGAQQRILPRGNFAPSIRAIPPLPVPIAARAFTPLSGVPVPPTRMPAGTPSMASPIVAISYMTPSVARRLPTFVFSTSVASGMPVFNAPIDSTLRVQRPALTLRSLIAVPIGALVAILLIAAGYRATSMSAPRAFAAVQLAASAHLVTAPAVSFTPREALITPSPIEGVASFDVRAVAPPTIPSDVPAPIVKRSGRNHSHRPRKIVAGDTSTPLGNLRPHRY